MNNLTDTTQVWWIEPDVLLVDKPYGWTSFDVIRVLRRQLNIKKIGHAGTLDPLATGLMILGIGSGTKKLTNYLKLPKSYEAQVLLGMKSDTADAEGDIVEQVTLAPDDISDEQINDVIVSLIGDNHIPVPMYSAIKVDGKPLYAYARAGKTPPTIPTKPMTVTSARLDHREAAFDTIMLHIHLAVSSGTYIRALAEHIGTQLGVPAMLGGLRRDTMADYKIDDAYRLGDLR